MIPARLASLADWLDAADPGAVRRRHGARAALAAVSTWLTLRLLPAGMVAKPELAIAIFGVAASFVCSLVVVDPRRMDRAVTLAASAAVLGVAAALAALVGELHGLTSVALLVLVFATFEARRLGLRIGELALVGTMGLYFADNAGVAPGNVAWFAAAAAIAVAWVAAWTFLLLPYDPSQAVTSAARAFSRRAADLVDAARRRLREDPGAATSAANAAGLQRAMRRVRVGRTVIESQFPGALAPSGWTSTRLERLQASIYEAELGLGLLVDATADPPALAAIPDGLRAKLDGLLAALAASLRDVTDVASMRRLQEESQLLRDEARVAAARGPAPGEEPTSLHVWAGPALRLALGSRRVARALAEVRDLRAASSEDADVTRETGATAPGRVAATRPRPMPPMGPGGLHPATVLGIQAVVATGLAMAAAWLAGLDHPNWVFWTSFMVISGSVGESLRRMLLRVVGTTAGVVFGVGLALLLPDQAGLVLAVAAGAIFLTIYWAPVSHAAMIFWLNIGFVLMMSQLGAGELHLLVDRPFSVFAGAAIAALVVLTVLPMPVTARYRRALAAYLGTISDALETWLPGPDRPAAQPASVIATEAAVDAAHAAVVRMLPGLAFESDPVAASRSPRTGQDQEIAAVTDAMDRLGRAVVQRLEDGRSGSAGAAAAVAGRVRTNIGALVAVIGGAQATIDSTLGGTLGPDAASIALRGAMGPDDGGGQTAAAEDRGDGVVGSLLDVHVAIVNLARALGGTVSGTATTAPTPTPHRPDAKET